MHAVALKLPMVIHKKADNIDTSFQIYSHTIYRNVHHKLELFFVIIENYSVLAKSVHSDKIRMLNINSVIVVICLGRKSQLMEQILELTDVSLTILDITINVVSIQESFKNKNVIDVIGSLEFKI